GRNQHVDLETEPRADTHQRRDADDVAEPARDRDECARRHHAFPVRLPNRSPRIEIMVVRLSLHVCWPKMPQMIRTTNAIQRPTSPFVSNQAARRQHHPSHSLSGNFGSLAVSRAWIAVRTRTAPLFGTRTT